MRCSWAWHDARHGDWDVFLRRSHDGGRTWRSVQRLNDDPVGNGRHQYLPRVAAAPDGRLDVVFYDRRTDPDNTRNDVAYTFSRDGGKTFRASVKLTARSFDSRFGQRYAGAAAQGLVEFGSRLGLFSWDERAIAAWTDTRNAVVPPHQDIFATHVELPGTSGGRGWASSVFVVLAGGGTVVAMTMAVTLVARRRRTRGAGGDGGTQDPPGGHELVTR